MLFLHEPAPDFGVADQRARLWIREQMAGESIYEDSFIMHWLSELLFYQAPSWVFVVCYTVFGGLVLASWFLVRPRAFSIGFQSSAASDKR